MDAASLDATHTYIAGKCGLVPVVTEYYGTVLGFSPRSDGWSVILVFDKL